MEKRKGFIKHLFSHTNNKVNVNPRSNIKAIVEGLYGKELNLKSYSIVLLFIIGIGIIG